MKRELPEMPSALPCAIGLFASVAARYAHEATGDSLSKTVAEARTDSRATAFSHALEPDSAVQSDVKAAPPEDPDGPAPDATEPTSAFGEELPTRAQQSHELAPQTPEPTLLALHRVERSGHLTPGPRLRSVAEKVLSTPLPSLRVHDNAAADSLARRLGADAFTFGDHVAFRSGLFGDESAEQVALFVHEAAHAEAHRFQAAGPAAEHEALNAEAAVFDLLAPSRAVAREPSAQPLAAPQPQSPVRGAKATAQSSAPMTDVVHRADSQRVVERTGAPGGGAYDIEQIKREVYQHIVARLRSDFERGE